MTIKFKNGVVKLPDSYAIDFIGKGYIISVVNGSIVVREK